MENQGKRLLIAVVLALGIVVVWNLLFPSDSPQKKATPDLTGEKPRVDSPVGIPTGASEVVAAYPAQEDITTFEYPNLRVELSSRDAKVVSWVLLDKKYERDWRKGEMIGSREHGALSVNFYKSPIVIPSGARWQKKADAEELPNEATYTYEDDHLKVVKIFHIHPDDYLIDMGVTVELKKDPAKPNEVRKVTQQLAISIVGRQDPKAPTEAARTVRVSRATCHLNGGISQLDARRLEKNGPDEKAGKVRWIGFNHPYLFFAVAAKGIDNQTLGCNRYPVTGVEGGMQVDLVYPTVELNSDAPPTTAQVAAFIGPKHLDALETADDIEGFNTGFSSSIDMGWFAIIARPLLSLLTLFYGWVGNWGVSIILLTICVKLATLYWTTKSMRSMKAMASLKPKIDELQKKYGDDRAKIQQEMMALYKAHGVNPLSGCLPMVLQMPIWFALYKMLSSAGELYLAPFIHGWISDLTNTDPYYILPVVLMGFMFLQSKLSPATVDNFQQKMMIYGIPLIFGVMSFFFPSGLSLYILTNTILSLLHTLYMRKFDKGGKVAVAAQQALDEEKRKLEKSHSKKPVVDVVAKEVEESSDEPEPRDDGDDEGDEPAEPAKPASASQPQRKSNAPRRKRKRKH
jgi:YidC/Oxa1 family membrane protein insertase